VYAAADADVTVKQDRNANITANLLRDAGIPVDITDQLREEIDTEWKPSGRRPPARTRSARPATCHIGQAVPAQRDGERDIQQDLARIVHRPALPPRLKRCRYRRIQTGLADRLRQEHRAGLRDDSATVALDADT
jgi:hypothetical protein